MHWEAEKAPQSVSLLWRRDKSYAPARAGTSYCSSPSRCAKCLQRESRQLTMCNTRGMYVILCFRKKYVDGMGGGGSARREPVSEWWHIAGMKQRSKEAGWLQPRDVALFTYLTRCSREAGQGICRGAVSHCYMSQRALGAWVTRQPVRHSHRTARCWLLPQTAGSPQFAIPMGRVLWRHNRYKPLKCCLLHWVYVQVPSYIGNMSSIVSVRKFMD
jgi:hypothetical protein